MEQYFNFTGNFKTCKIKEQWHLIFTYQIGIFKNKRFTPSEDAERWIIPLTADGQFDTIIGKLFTICRYIIKGFKVFISSNSHQSF